MGKFILLMGGVLGTLTLVGAAWRLAGLRKRLGPEQASHDAPPNFESLSSRGKRRHLLEPRGA